MKLQVKLFAGAKEACGTDCIEVTLPETARVADLRVQLAQQLPQLKPMADSLLVAVGTEYADDEKPIDPTAEIACFPPVSGG